MLNFQVQLITLQYFILQPNTLKHILKILKKQTSLTQKHIKQNQKKKKKHTPFLTSTICSSSIWQQSPTISKSSPQNGHRNSCLNPSSPSISSPPLKESASTQIKKPQISAQFSKPTKTTNKYT